MTTEAQKKSARKRAEKKLLHPKVKGLRLKRNNDGTFTTQYGVILSEYINSDGQNDLRPTGLDPRGGSQCRP
jgi:hypothetical protein